MSANPGKEVPYNAYPRDVTSPGPYQQPGVARSQSTFVPLNETQPSPLNPPTRPKDASGPPEGAEE